MLRWLLHPCSPQHFRHHVLGQGVLYIPRNGTAAQHNAGCFGERDVWDALERQQLHYGSQVDVTTFDAQRQRQTYNFNADAAPDLVEVRSRC